MPQITLQCFITPEEFSHTLQRVCELNGLGVLEVQSLRAGDVVPLNLDCLSAATKRCLLVGKLPFSEDLISGSNESPPRWGLANIKPPGVENDMLSWTLIGARSDWLAGDCCYDNQESLRVAKLLKKAFQKLLVEMTFISTATTRTSNAKPFAKLSSGALEWVRKGGKLVFQFDTGSTYRPETSITPASMLHK